ncbi:helix-turn-helix domain-containing protein, partial [Acinetobacter sp.]
NLSESRFSHWFSDNFGISYRSYRKWLRLLQSFQAIDQDINLTSIAHHAHFSDQAHFSRTCKQMFGIQPSLLKFIPSIEQMPILLLSY